MCVRIILYFVDFRDSVIGIVAGRRTDSYYMGRGRHIRRSTYNTNNFVIIYLFIRMDLRQINVTANLILVYKS